MEQSNQTAQPEMTTSHTPDPIDPAGNPQEPVIATRPDQVPEKFWDQDQGSIRTDVLLKSYGELERRLGDGVTNIPESPDAYELTMPDEQIQPDIDVNARLHAAGFTQEQTQLVYDLAYEKLSPLIAETTAELYQGAAINQLENHFGGKARWQETSRQLNAWGQSNLPSETFDSLSSSIDGVIAMHQMMKTSEPSLMGNRGEITGARGESDLKQMMQDPRYWRDQDPAFIEQVRKGFLALYPD